MSRTTDRENQLSPVKRALLEIRELRAKIEETEYSMREPIAIIGMGLRFPGGANDPGSFWRLLHDGVDAITEVPRDRWDVNEYYDPNPDAPGKMSSRWGGFLKEIDKFDPEFFGISPREAVTMDPQQRLLLEVVWESLENAGQVPNELFGSLTGVFIGISTFDYLQDQMQKIDLKYIDAYFATGNTHSVASGRISYVLGLRGPSLSLDTACSSSLVAIHQACQSLRARECNMALAGGVNLILRPEFHINFSKTHVMAADGRCKAFDSRADGFVRSEGCGIIVIKRLSDALHDSDPILAIIRGSAVNQDGRSSGLTAPNGPSQQAVIRNALANAGVSQNEVQYVEAHGTGTALGDPIEVQALAAVLGEGRSKSESLIIGSVKTNIGHLEAAAGVAGLIKVILMLRNGWIPPHLHVKKLNPHISWEEIPITVTTRGMPWRVQKGKRIAGVSSFGFSGTNAHIVVEEAPRQERAGMEEERPLHLLTLSAQAEPILQESARRLASHLSNEGYLSLGDVAHTTNAGRSHFPRRLALIAASSQEAYEKLHAMARGEKPAGMYCNDATNQNETGVAFLFTGQGARHANTGRQLLDTQPTFRTTIEQCDEYSRRYLDLPLKQILFSKEAESSLVSETAESHTALFALEYALARLWGSWGIQPSAVIGHGLGEYVAACLAGVFTLEEGLQLVAERGRMIQRLSTQGAMAVVFTGEEQVRIPLGGRTSAISVAAINSPNNIVISGEKDAIQTMLAELKQKGIRTQPLSLSHAFHSIRVEPMLDDFESFAKQVHFRDPEIPLISNLTGGLLENAESGNALYWRRHAQETVRFADGVRTLYEKGHRLFLEIGPHPSLCGLGRECILDDNVLWLPSLKRDQNDWQQMLESLAQLYIRGVKVDWHGFDHDYGRIKVSIPTYPFQRDRYWVKYDGGERQQSQGKDSSQRWKDALAAGDRQSLQVPMDLGLHTYGEKWRSLQALTTAYIVRTLRQLGLFVLSGEMHTVAELLEKCGIAVIYHGLIWRWLIRLKNEGILIQEGERFISANALPELEIGPLLNKARQSLHDIGFLLDYVEQCGEMLGSILTGKQSPLEALFPGGSFQVAENIYQHWALSRYFNGIIAAGVRAFVSGLAPNQKVRVLEVGTGTGGTTSEVVSVLPGDRTLYLYTDMSEVFFDQAKRKFDVFPFIRYATLDIERNPCDQGFNAHSVDILIAANVLHATRNLYKTAQNVLSLLAPGGLLLLYEVTDPHSWFDTTVALIEGWQLFEDNLRKDGPLLSVREWQNLLHNQGFAEVVAFPRTGSEAEVLKAHVIMARAPKSSDSYEGEFPIGFADPSAQLAPSVVKTDQAEEMAELKGAVALIDRLKQATPDERHELLIDYVRGHVIHVLKRDSSKPLDRHHRLMDLGIDSLMAVELRNRLGTGLGLKRRPPATLIFDYPTIDAVADYLVRETVPPSSQTGEKNNALSHGGDSMWGADNRIKDLSDKEMERLVLEKLKSLEKGK